MNGVAAKITKKIRMLLEHTYIHARPGQKKAQHHAGWSSSGNAATSVDGFGHIKGLQEHGRDYGKGKANLPISLRSPGLHSIVSEELNGENLRTYK
jgi:hypothetical protein